MNSSLTRFAVMAGITLTGCASLEPTLPMASPEVAWAWQGQEKGAALDQIDLSTQELQPEPIDWKSAIHDPYLQQLITRALGGNRDLRQAVLRLQQARATYRIEESYRAPTLSANASVTRGASGNQSVAEAWHASVQLSGYELDIFDRLENLSDAAWRRYIAEDYNRQAVELSIVADVSNTYLDLLANMKLRELANITLTNREASYALSQDRYQMGDVSALDLAQERTAVEAARRDVARFDGIVSQARNALALLIGEPIRSTDHLEGVAHYVITSPIESESLRSDILLSRPDIRAAEYQLRAANANIGAARAAFFPSIRLTASGGYASDALSGLFDSGTSTWAFTPQINLPIFQAGRLQAGLASQKLERDLALANYEQCIQSGFREVADGLARHESLKSELMAQMAMLDAALKSHRLSQVRYEAGMDSYLVLLEAERTLYSAKQELISLQLAQQKNWIGLFKALGGRWRS